MNKEYFPFDKYKDKMYSNGVAMSASLFEETNVTSIKPLFKLSEWHKVYIEMSDPTEYTTAMVLCGNWEFWNKLKESVSIGPYMKAWKDELEVKLRSEGIIALVKQAKDGNASAARYLADAEFFGTKREKRTKAEKAALSASIEDKVKKDMERLGLSVVNGNKGG